MIELFSNPENWIALATLTALEIVLGIDNIVFIAILSDRVPKAKRALAYRLGLGGAMFTRIGLLLTISWVMGLVEPLFSVLGHEVSGRGLILLAGGIFLIGKSAHEIYEKVIEHTLIQPTFVTRMPAFLVPLAKKCADDPSVVDVYELEINGQEISPGYSELNDPIEQRSRFDQQLIDAQDDEHEVERIDEDFLTAMEHGMPPAGGLGMGIDRLVMLLTGVDSIRDVILFPQMRPSH